MSRLDEIKEEVAKEYGFRDWKTFTYQKYASERKEGQDEVTRRYATEAVEAFGKKLLKDESFHVTTQDGDTIEVIQIESIEAITIDLP